MRYFEFTDDEKARMFDQIADRYYCQNFGQMGKADIELMMFSFYMKKLVKTKADENNVVDYNQISDYLISQELGITQQRVRNFKVKSQLVYPIDYQWQSAFIRLVENARYDSVTKKVVLNIPDPNIFLEIQNYIESTGAYIEKQLNNKLLQIRVEFFIDLLVAADDGRTRETIIKEIRKQLHEKNQDEIVLDERKLGKTLIEMGADVTSILVNISTIIGYAGMAKPLCDALINLITGK